MASCKLSNIRAFDQKQKGVRFTAWFENDDDGRMIEAVRFGGNYSILCDDLKSDDDERAVTAKADVVSILMEEIEELEKYTEISVD